MKTRLLLPLLLATLGTARAVSPPPAFVPYPSLAKAGYSAPGQVDTAFSTLGFGALSPTGEVLFETRLIGTGSSAGRNRALFSALSGDTDLVRQSGFISPGFASLLSGSKLTTFLSPIHNRTTAAIFQATATGPGINSTNNRLIILSGGITISAVSRTGLALAALGGAIPSTYLEVLQQEGANDRIALVYKLKTGVASTNAKNDSGLLLMTHEGSVTHSASREGSPTFLTSGALPPEVFGQFGRATILTGDAVGFICKVIPPVGTPIDSLFLTGLVNSRSSLSQGITPPGPGFTTERLGTFTGVDRLNNLPLLRATLTLSPTATNQGVWNSGGTLLLRKGQTIGSATVTKILRVWGLNNNQLLAHVQLSNQASALMLRQVDGSFVTLLSTLAQAPGFLSGINIASIQAIDVDPVNGHYVVLASLKGLPASENQALWTGEATLGSNDSELAKRIPVPQLRKGSNFFTTNTPNDLIRSIALRPVIDPTGVGARGFGQQINSAGRTLVTITGDRGVKELITIK